MKLSTMLILAGLLLTIGAAAYAQGNPSGGKFVHRGWLGRLTYTAPVGVNQPEQDSLSGSNDAYSREQALQPESSASPTTKSDR